MRCLRAWAKLGVAGHPASATTKSQSWQGSRGARAVFRHVYDVVRLPPNISATTAVAAAPVDAVSDVALQVPAYLKRRQAKIQDAKQVALEQDCQGLFFMQVHSCGG